MHRRRRRLAEEGLELMPAQLEVLGVARRSPWRTAPSANSAGRSAPCAARRRGAGDVGGAEHEAEPRAPQPQRRRGDDEDERQRGEPAARRLRAPPERERQRAAVELPRAQRPAAPPAAPRDRAAPDRRRCRWPRPRRRACPRNSRRTGRSRRSAAPRRSATRPSRSTPPRSRRRAPTGAARPRQGRTRPAMTPAPAPHAADDSGSMANQREPGAHVAVAHAQRVDDRIAASGRTEAGPHAERRPPPQRRHRRARRAPSAAVTAEAARSRRSRHDADRRHAAPRPATPATRHRQAPFVAEHVEERHEAQRRADDEQD